MASGQKTKLQYDFAICGECKYSTAELVRDYPDGTGASSVECTGILLTVHGSEPILAVMPHRPDCIFHTNQRECQA